MLSLLHTNNYVGITAMQQKRLLPIPYEMERANPAVNMPDGGPAVSEGSTGFGKFGHTRGNSNLYKTSQNDSASGYNNGANQVHHLNYQPEHKSSDNDVDQTTSVEKLNMKI